MAEREEVRGQWVEMGRPGRRRIGFLRQELEAHLRASFGLHFQLRASEATKKAEIVVSFSKAKWVFGVVVFEDRRRRNSRGIMIQYSADTAKHVLLLIISLYLFITFILMLCVSLFNVSVQ